MWHGSTSRLQESKELTWGECSCTSPNNSSALALTCFSSAQSAVTQLWPAGKFGPTAGVGKGHWSHKYTCLNSDQPKVSSKAKVCTLEELM